MANRHQRRKAAKAKAEATAIALAQAERSMKIAAIVKDNKSAPIERVYFSPRSPIADAKGNVYTGYREPRAGGAMNEKSVQALKSRANVTFGKADGLTPDSASLAGQRLSGRAIREARFAEMQAKLDRLRQR